MARPLEDVYCTLLMSDSYLPGAAVLSNSLRDAGTKKKLAVLITLDTLSAETITQLKALYDYLIPVERIRNPNPANLYLMGRPDLSFAFTKIALWRQTQFRKIVYLDADVVALRALDELFDIDASFAAAPDIGWPDAFNSGVMVITPDMGEYWALQTMAATGDSFDGADQGLLNQYFEHRPWQRLKFTYNCTPNAEYQWEPAYRYYKRDISAVHFIGKNKPWSAAHSGGSGVYGELLARWWAVHNRHMAKLATTSQSSSVPSQQSQGEIESISTSASSSPSSAPIPEGVVEPEAPLITTEPPMTEPSEQAENIDQGVIEPTSTVQQRKFSAPLLEWDATRFEPPAQSKPEAANFPSAQYTFSASHELFKPPAVYAEPPKDMWYRVPETKPMPSEKPKPIFPWEREPDRPKPTRVFAEDLPPEPSAAPEISSPTHPFSTVHYENSDQETLEEGAEEITNQEQVSPPKSADKKWQAFQQSNVNAWDSVPGIEDYVRTIVEARDGRRGKALTLQQAAGVQDLGSPLLERRNRHESLIITDFPSAVERPSLPVTPAPIRRPSFWGDGRDETGELPGAEGVPDQAQWNPEAKLDQLRRSSLVEFEHLKKDEHPSLPLRALPEHSILEEQFNSSAKNVSSTSQDTRKIHTPTKAIDEKSRSESSQGNTTQQVNPVDNPASASSLSGVAAFDFALNSGTVASGKKTLKNSSESAEGLLSSQQSTTGGLSSEGFFVSSTQISSSSASEQASSTQTTSTVERSSSNSGGQHITSGKMTFKVPDFDEGDANRTARSREQVLSPTQAQEDADNERKGGGLL